MIKTDYALPDTIALSATSVGLATATLATTEWSDVSGLRVGYLITTPDGGQALITKEPQHQSPIVDIQIIQPFGNLSYTSGQWTLGVPRGRHVNTYIPSYVGRTLIIPEYLDSLQDTFIDEIQDSITRLRNIRRWDKMDSDYLDLFLQTMGMVINSEQFDLETRRRLINELPAFVEVSGTENFLKYLGFSVGAQFEATQLWTKDYKSFIVEADIPPLEVDDYYPTNHVTLEFDAVVYGAIDPNIISDLFYSLASTPLVLDNIFQSITSDPLVVQGVTTTQVYLDVTSEFIP